MAQTKEILTQTRVTIVNSTISIYTYFQQAAVKILNFFISEIVTIINNIAFNEGELGYTQENTTFSASLNSAGELIVVDDDVSSYFIDGDGEFVEGSALPAPVATAATNVGSSSFTANWNAVTGATGYLLDVATDGAFNSLVLFCDVGNVTSFNVAGISSGTYYYRVWAYDGVQVSSDSNTIIVNVT